MHYIIYYAYLGDDSTDASTLVSRLSYIERQLLWIKKCITCDARTNLNVIVAITCPVTHDDIINRLVISFDFSLYPLVNRRNTFEYHGFTCLMDIASKISPSDFIFYCHSKGVVNKSAIALSIFKMHTSLLLNENILLSDFDKYDKIGLFPSEYGWMWHNFFWIKAQFLLQKKLRNLSNRHYYESFIGDFSNPNGYASCYAHRPEIFEVNGFINKPFYNASDINSNVALQAIYKNLNLINN